MDEKAFIKKAGDVSLKVLNTPWNEVIYEYDKLWENVRTDFSGSSELLQELQRRIWESKITFFPETAPKEPFDILWREMLELGFSDLDRRASMAFFRANYLCERTDGSNEDFEIATKMIEDAAKTFKADNKIEMSEHYERVLKRLQQRREKVEMQLESINGKSCGAGG